MLIQLNSLSRGDSKITKKQMDWQFWTLRGFIFALQEMDEGKDYD
jgi:hypothetical protein